MAVGGQRLRRIQLTGPLIGRPNTKIRQAHVNDSGQADYLVLDNVDWRSSADAQFGTTKFYQGTMNFRQEFGDRFRADGTNERGLAVMEIDNNTAVVISPAPHSFASG